MRRASGTAGTFLGRFHGDFPDPGEHVMIVPAADLDALVARVAELEAALEQAKLEYREMQDRAAAALPDIEACARAAYDAAHGGIPRYRWDAPEGDYSVRSEVKDVYRAVARAVLAAAGVGR